MAGKKQYYGLDEIGFLGVQDKRSRAQEKRDIAITVQYIKAKKSGRVVPLPSKGKLAKAK